MYIVTSQMQFCVSGVFLFSQMEVNTDSCWIMKQVKKKNHLCGGPQAAKISALIKSKHVTEAVRF